MRSVALIAALACATAAHADGVRESRYGPERERASTPLESGAPGFTGAAYEGRMLGWGGKREPVAPQIEAPPAQQPWWGRAAPQAAPTHQPQPQPQPRAQAAYPAQSPTYAPPAYAPASRALPRNIYDAPPPAAQAAPAQTVYATAPQAEPMRTPWKEGQVGARTYSVGRQFGMTPDPIPAAGPPRMVMIAAPPMPDDDKPRNEDDRDWPAKTEKDRAN